MTNYYLSSFDANFKDCFCNYLNRVYGHDVLIDSEFNLHEVSLIIFGIKIEMFIIYPFMLSGDYVLRALTHYDFYDQKDIPEFEKLYGKLLTELAIE